MANLQGRNGRSGKVVVEILWKIDWRQFALCKGFWYRAE